MLQRRTLLGGAIIALGAAVLSLGGMTCAFLKAPRRSNVYGTIVSAGPLHELPPPGAPPENIAAGRFWLVHDEAGMSALHSSCTHLECLFGWDREKQVFVCPCHGSEFDRNGKVLKGPATRDLDRFPIQFTDSAGELVRQGPQESDMGVPTRDLLTIEEPENQGEEGAIQRNDVFVQVDTGRKISGADRVL